jgi:hypothetical protein
MGLAKNLLGSIEFLQLSPIGSENDLLSYTPVYISDDYLNNIEFDLSYV